MNRRHRTGDSCEGTSDKELGTTDIVWLLGTWYGDSGVHMGVEDKVHGNGRQRPVGTRQTTVSIMQ